MSELTELHLLRQENIRLRQQIEQLTREHCFHSSGSEKGCYSCWKGTADRLARQLHDLRESCQPLLKELDNLEGYRFD